MPGQEVACAMNRERRVDVDGDKVVVAVLGARCDARGGFGGLFGEALHGFNVVFLFAF